MSSRDLKVMCVDPGITTGYATGLIDVDAGKIGIISGQQKWNELDFYLELKRTKPDILIYERFEYRSQKAYNVDNAELFSRNLIGVANLYAQERIAQGAALEGLYTQMPAAVLGKNGWWSDKHLKEVALYKQANPHAMDACRHLCYWFSFGAGFRYNKHQAIKDSFYSLV